MSNSLFHYFVKNHNLYLTQGELDGIRNAVRGDILPADTCSITERASAAIESLWEFSPCSRYSTDHRAIKAAIETLGKIAGTEVCHG